GGDALARDDGRVVLAPFAIPGERVRVEPEQEKSGLIRARVVEVLTPAPARVDPPCPYFAQCGGCHYQHAAYEFQVEQKASILREQLARVGKIRYDGEIERVF